MKLPLGSSPNNSTHIGSGIIGPGSGPGSGIGVSTSTGASQVVAYGSNREHVQPNVQQNVQGQSQSQQSCPRVGVTRVVGNRGPGSGPGSGIQNSSSGSGSGGACCIIN